MSKQKYGSYASFAKHQKMHPIVKLGCWIWSLFKAIASFFYPFAVKEDVPREMYKRSFHWCFLLVLCLALPYYLFLQDNVYVEKMALSIANIVRYARGREYHSMHLDDPVENINGIFLLFAGLLCIGLFQYKIDDIPPTYRDFGLKTAFSMGSLLYFIPAGAVLVKINEYLESDPRLTFQNGMLLFILAFTYGFSGFIFTRFMFDFSAWTGWRKTVHSPWRFSKSIDYIDQHDRRSK